MYTVQYIAKAIGGKIEGDPNLKIIGICDLKNGINNCISFLSRQDYKKYFFESLASAVIVDENYVLPNDKKTVIRVKNPALGFIKTINLFFPSKTVIGKIHPLAVVHTSVKKGKNINISPMAVIDKDVEIGDDVSIGAGVYIGEGSKIGSKTKIDSNVTIRENVIIGNNVNINSGTVIGSDGFGIIKDGEKQHQFPHLGSVKIGNDVMIGANCSIDRGTIGNTIIGEQSKLDNQIQIAHNVKIGRGCIIASQVGIAGSSILGDFVTIAGQVGVVSHIKIGDGSTIASKSAVMQEVGANSIVSGIPAQNHKNNLRQVIALKKLPNLLKKLREYKLGK